MKIVEDKYIDAFDEFKRLREFVGDDEELLDSLIGLLNPSELEPLARRLVDMYEFNSPLSAKYREPRENVKIHVYDVKYFHDTALPSEFDITTDFDPDVHKDLDDAVYDAVDDYIHDRDKGNFATQWDYKEV